MNNKLELNQKHISILNKIEDSLQEVYDHFRSLSNRIEYLTNENEKLKSENYKDQELSKMKSEYDKMKSDYYRGFPISENEQNQINEWIGEQIKKHPANSGVSGGRFIYKFQPTGLGTIGTVIDTFTDDKLTFQEL